MSNGAKIWWMRPLRYKALYFGRLDFDQQIKHRVLKYLWVGLVKMNNVLYNVLTYVNTNINLPVLM